MKPMRVLITNYSIEYRAGTELYVRDLAVGLMRAGHRPMVWSPRLGELANEFRQAGIPITDTLDSDLPTPDLIHGHHHDETLAALARFPDRPGLYVLHDAQAWQDLPPQHPRLLRYLAVDELCQERLIANGIPFDQTEVQPNWVDLARFRPRAALPAVPRRALAFANTAQEGSFLPMLRETCARAGIELDVAGSGSGNTVSAPEQVLGNYDLVFAKARAALEALAVGCAVVVVDLRGVAGMVNTGNVEQWRRWNYGRALLDKPHNVDLLAEEIASFDPNDAHECSQFVRTNCSLDRSVAGLVHSYDAILKRWESGEIHCDPIAELRQAATRLELIGPLRMAKQELELQVQNALPQVSVLTEHCHALQASLDAHVVALQARESEVIELQQKVARLSARRLKLLAENAQLRGSRYYRLRAKVRWRKP